MDLGKFEDELTQRLAIRGVNVNVLPHVGVLNEPRHTAKPQLFIILNNSTFDNPQELPALAQLENIQGEIFIRAKNRRGKLGVFDLYNQITPLLMGYQLTGAKTPVYLTGFGYVAGLQNNWQYALTFTFSAYRFKAYESETPVTLKQVKQTITTV